MEIDYKKCTIQQKRQIVRIIRRTYPNASIRDIISGVYFVEVENNRITKIYYTLQEATK